MKCKKEFELVANMNKHINDMRITQPFWTKWKHIGNIDTEKRTQERKKNNNKVY